MKRRKIDRRKIGSDVHSVEKREIYSQWKYISWNLSVISTHYALISPFFVNVTWISTILVQNHTVSCFQDICIIKMRWKRSFFPTVSNHVWVFLCFSCQKCYLFLLEIGIPFKVRWLIVQIWNAIIISQSNNWLYSKGSPSWIVHLMLAIFYLFTLNFLLKDRNISSKCLQFC